MNLISLLVTVSLGTSPSSPPLVDAPVAESSQKLQTSEPARAIFSLSPHVTLLGGMAFEAEVAVASRLSLYGYGEGYTFWDVTRRPGWGVQAGGRFYFAGTALNGGFIDLHGRANELRYLFNFLGGGIEAGGTHQIGSSHLSVSWSLGVDGGVGRVRFWDSGTDGLLDRASPMLLPKVRVMLGYRF